ncbi:hypothetical protein K1T71_008153 [Dendrolimus kikuchii]|uniref:Uncharacterized protein n=1 Tax=Dendrolimus kikuchii TaxID=765133 RepID=A0ACC1CW82_9NEOP|nr:hypothetical protein K1T71_008153 [Dendrolimus kikuchii]
MGIRILFLVCLIKLVLCRDFYIGMFKKNDFLVAQDRLYKDKVPFRYAYGKYGRVFKCPISYIRVVDRLGFGRGTTVQIVRGGLQNNYVVLRLISSYNQPISVNIYVGCSSVKITRPTLAPKPASDEHINKEVNVSSSEEENTTVGADSITNGGEGNSTTVDNDMAANNGTAVIDNAGGTDVVGAPTTEVNPGN